MISTFNAQSPSPVVQQADVADLHPTFAGICRSFVSNAARVAEQPNGYLFTPLSDPEADLSYPEIMRYPITVGKNVRQPENITIRDISYVIAAIRQGFYEGYNLKKAVSVIRGMTDKDAQRNAKSTLPWFSGSLMHTKRANANVKHASFMIFDLDHVKDIEAIKALSVSKFPWIRYAFHSVTDGVKLVAMLSKPLTNEEKFRTIYSYLSLQLETLLKVPCDHTPDWARACFMSYDPELIDNLRRLKPIDVDDYYRQALSFRELNIVRIAGVDAAHIAGVDAANAHSRAVSQSKGGMDYSEPCQDTRVVHLAASQGNKHKTGISQIDSTNIEDDYAKAEQIVATLSKIKLERQDWIKIGYALYSAFGEGGKPLWDMFVDNPNYNDTQRKIDMHWHSFKNVRSITISSLFYLADKYGVDHE